MSNDIRSVFGNKSSGLAKKKLVIFTSNCLVAHQHLNDLMPFLYQNGITPVVLITPPSKSPRAAIPSLKHYDFYESGILEDVIYPTVEERSSCVNYLAPTFNQLAQQYSFTPVEIPSLKDPAVKAVIEDPEMMGAISIYQDAIFKPDLIQAIKKQGFLWNLHPALLPESQGLYIIFWSLLAGKRAHGYSLHEIDEGIDTGRLIARFDGQLDPRKCVAEQYFRFVHDGSRLVQNALTDFLRDGTVKFAEPSGKKPEYFTFPTEDDIARGWQRNVRLWGSPYEMAGAYARIFGNDPVLRERILDAIYRKEGIEFSCVTASVRPKASLRPAI